jgi:hypothetical protein
MSISEFYKFWESKECQVTSSISSSHYFVRSYELWKGRLTEYGKSVRRMGGRPPVVLVYTRKEIAALTLADLEEHYVGKQLEAAFGL